MMLKKIRCLVLAMVLILVVISCTTFAAVKPVKLVFGSVFPTDHYYVKGDLYFKELVEKNSKGKMIIDYYPANQLGGLAEMLQATRTGAQQIGMGSVGSLSTYWSKLGTFDLPYLFRDQKHYQKVAEKLTSVIDQKELVARTGMRILGVRLSSPRHLTTKFPVNKVEDIKGIKMRVGENAISQALWKALGTIPTVIPPADLYTALATGTVDAQENPLATTNSMKLYEQVKYCALTAHTRTIEPTLININCWNSLTKAQQKILSAAAAKSAAMISKAAVDDEEKYQQLLAKEGMKFTKPNLVPFREKAKTMWGQFGDAEMIKKIEAVK
jgi:tripartite ATP-independent transporter DctP family solute receptor